MSAQSIFHHIWLSLDLSRVVTVSLDLGLLGSLCERNATAEGHATALELEAAPTAEILRVLVAAGFAQRDGDRYRASSDLEHLARRLPLGLEGNRTIWAHLPTYARTHRSIMDCDVEESTRGETYRDVVPSLANLAHPSARMLADHLAARAPKRVLDVGAGSGVWGLAVAERVPDVHVTALDLPEVVHRVDERAASLDLTGRVTAVGGSYKDDPIVPGTFDVVILAAILHLETEAEAAGLIARAAKRVAPGGVLVPVDAFGEGVMADLGIGLYALNLAMRTRQGRPHPQEKVRAWLSQAGLTNVELVPLEFPGMSALVARRP